MTHTWRMTIATMALLAGAAALTAQRRNAEDVLGEARHALGGETKVAGVKTLTATGRTRAQTPRGQTEEMEFVLSLELPDKFMKRDVLMASGPTSVYRHTGFNGDGLIDEVDAPPALASGGGMIVRRIDFGGGPGRGTPTPEQAADDRLRRLTEARHSFARLTLGMFASSFAGYPLTFTYAGVAESPDGKADVLDVSGAGDFRARLFVDAVTHLPLMLSWMDKEPIEIRVENSGGGERVEVLRGGGGPGDGRSSGAPATDRSIEARMREAEAARRTVEFRMFYEDYKDVDGVKFPMRISRTVDGRPSTEVLFDRVRLNTRIDPKTFTPTAK